MSHTKHFLKPFGFIRSVVIVQEKAGVRVALFPSYTANGEKLSKKNQEETPVMNCTYAEPNSSTGFINNVLLTDRISTRQSCLANLEFKSCQIQHQHSSS